MSSKEAKTPLLKDDKILAVQNEINQTQQVMLKNIDAALERGEKLNTLEDKAENMTHHARQFKKTASNVKSHFCIQYYKTIAIVLIVLAIIGVVLYFVLRPKN